MNLPIADLPVQIIKQGRLFIAYSHALDISTSGKSEKEAVERFGDILQIFIRELIQKGSLDHSLVALGWTRRNKRWAPPGKTIFGKPVEAA